MKQEADMGLDIRNNEVFIRLMKDFFVNEMNFLNGQKEVDEFNFQWELNEIALINNIDLDLLPEMADIK